MHLGPRDVDADIVRGRAAGEGKGGQSCHHQLVVHAPPRPTTSEAVNLIGHVPRTQTLVLRPLGAPDAGGVGGGEVMG